MDTIILTQGNLTTALKRTEPTYYIIDQTLPLTKSISFPAGSVLDFRGGSFEPMTWFSYSVSLNGSTVFAPAYCIFNGVEASGFTNSFIRAEWFKSKKLSEHEAINRSLVAANGIPVHLESRTYQLTGSIKFPDGQFNKTLVSPGVLQISEDIEAIVVDTTFVNLDINKIEYTGDDGRGGTGIKLTGNAYYLDIRVNILENLNKAIAVIPVIPKKCQNLVGCDAYKDCEDCEDCDECENSDKCKLCKECATKWSGIQYCTIRFKEILNAEYCFYVDIFSNSKYTTIDPDGNSLDTWFSEARVIGGKMSGVNGVYFINPDAENEKHLYDKNSGYINGLLFEDITFEDISGTPLFISHISSSKFLNLTFGKGLPGTEDNGWDQSKEWIYLNYVSYLIISVQDPLDPMRILLGDNISSVIFDAYIIDSFDNSANTVYRFDRLSIKPLTVKTIEAGKVKYMYPPQMTATSSVQPYNMAQTLESDKSPIKDLNRPLTIKDLLPLNEVNYLDDVKGDKISKFNILPRTLNLIIKEGDQVVIDLSGLSIFAPCMIDVYAMIARRGSLVFTTSQSPSQIKVLDNGEVTTGKTASFTELGIYRLTFDSDWDIVISKVTL